jgi:acetyl-CoA acetyltransferase
MSPSPQAPIIIGVGEIRQKKFTLENTLEPAELILSAIRDAAKDTTVDVIGHVDSISVVPPWSWTYDDLPKLLAEKLGVKPTHLELSSHGGHTPALLCDAAAARVAAGETKLAVVTGGEALASRKFMFILDEEYLADVVQYLRVRKPDVFLLRDGWRCHLMQSYMAPVILRF